MTRDKVTQEHVVLISPGPAADSPLRHAADTLAMVLGDDSGSRLYWALVDPGLADVGRLQLPRLRGHRLVLHLVQLRARPPEANLAIVHKVLADVQKNGITEEELHQAKSKIRSRVVRGSERPMGRMQALGMAWTYLNAIAASTTSWRPSTPSPSTPSARCSIATRSIA